MRNGNIISVFNAFSDGWSNEGKNKKEKQKYLPEEKRNKIEKLQTIK